MPKHELGSFCFESNLHIEDLPESNSSRQVDLNIDFQYDKSLANPVFEKSGKASYRYVYTDKEGFSLRDIIVYDAVPNILISEGKFLLHGSAVDWHKGAVAFLGISGSGKSTLAKSFYADGGRILTDDCLILEKNKACIMIEPYLAELRHWDNDTKITQSYADNDFDPKRKIKLKHIFILENPDLLNKKCNKSEVKMQRLNSAKQLGHLLPHVYYNRVLRKNDLKYQHDFICDLVCSGRVSVVHYPHNANSLKQVRRMILDILNESF